MEKKRCPSCGMPLKDGKCTICGYEGNVVNNPRAGSEELKLHDNLKYCKHCGELIDKECVVCPKCGKQVEDLKSDEKNIVINNSSSASSSASASAYVRTPQYYGKLCNKWTSFFLCLFLGFLGAHKFYEGKVGMGILYLCTLGLFGIGWIIDIFRILSKPNPYYA